MTRKIIHVDMDAFFASVEQRDDPRLRGRPVAVGGGNGRGVVAAASYEARVFGVRSAMPSVTARRRCPDLVFVPPRFAAYRAVSDHIRSIFADYADAVEPLSLDEAYLDVTADRRGLASATATAAEIRERIRAETGLTASAGVSYNKLLAKLASDENKPDGQCVVTPARGPGFVAALAVSRFHGIGPRTAERMHRLGIFTGADLRARSEAALVAAFGKAGSWYHRIARAEDDRPVSSDRTRKSSGSETTFAEDLHDQPAVLVAVDAIAAKMWRWCANGGGRARTLTVKLRYSDFVQVTRRATAPIPLANEADVRRLAGRLVVQLFPLRRPVRLLGVTLSGFDAAGSGGSATPLDFGAPLEVDAGAIGTGVDPSELTA